MVRRKIAAGILMSSLVFAGISYANPMDNAYGTRNHQGQQMQNGSGTHNGNNQQGYTMPQNQGNHNYQDNHQGQDNHNTPKHKGGKGGKKHR